MPLPGVDWFDRVRAATSDLPAIDGLGYRVEHRAGDERWHQVVEDGRIVAWDLGPLVDADLVLAWDVDDATAMLNGELWGSAALDRVALVDAVTGATLPPPPMDIATTAELAALPTVPHATMAVQYHFAQGPFGPVDYWWRFDEGRSTGMGLGRLPDGDPDVHVWISFRSMVDVRRGRISILDSLAAGGRVEGPVGVLMLLAGLEEGDELHAAELACDGDAGQVLASMGELACSDAYRRAMARAVLGRS